MQNIVNMIIKSLLATKVLNEFCNIREQNDLLSEIIKRYYCV